MNSKEPEALDLSDVWQVMLHQATIVQAEREGSSSSGMTPHAAKRKVIRDKALMDALFAAGKPLNMTELAKASSLTKNQIYRSLEDLVPEGQVIATEYTLQNLKTGLRMKVGPRATCQETVQ